jgi:membrane protease YdiL (CAAX protease family)
LNPACKKCLLYAIKVLWSLPLSLSLIWGEISWASEAKAKESLFWGPLASYLIPGSSQLYYGKYSEGSILFGTHLGLELSLRNMQRKLYKSPAIEAVREAGEDSYEAEQLYLFNRDSLAIDAMLGLQITNKGIGVYNSFRDAVDLQADSGEFSFLDPRESTQELLLSPFQFGHLQQPTTWGYILLQGVTSALTVHDRLKKPDEFERSQINGYQFATGFASHYGAGVGEETIFRGWMMPLLQAKTGRDWAANSLQALIFGAMHSDNFGGHALYGLYSGWMVQRQRGRLSEAIFAHTWGNMIGQVTSYMAVYRMNPKAAQALPIWLPELSIMF